ncbi:MAG TPA: efflux RND transporter periplasmic adaptor subunit [Thermoanaerobaculia bacterium]|nr:efflux RND transporter periplasmic adaptor subunit [Thermoanaerobaculia bacterium]
MRRTLFLLSLSAVLALAACGGNEETTAATTDATATVPLPLPADVATVGTAMTSTATATIEASAAPGTLVSTGEFVSPVRSEVAAKVIGRVSRVYVDEGARVTRGQPLLSLETDYLRLNLQAAEAQTAQARAALDEAQRDLARKQELIAKASIPQVTFDRSKATYEQTRAAHAGAAAQASLLRQQIADSTLRSPITGIVAEKRTDVGQKLGDGNVAFVVLQISPIKLRFSVPERYLGQVRVGQTVTAKVDPYPGETFTGTIKAVGGVINPQTRTMFAEAEFLNRDGRLRPGLFARIETKF